jgi:GTP cyclohydrolase I
MIYEGTSMHEPKEIVGIMGRQVAIEYAFATILHAIGEDPNREGPEETPKRFAKAYTEIFAGLTEDPKIHLQKGFTEGASNAMVIETGIPFYSMCEHHFVPFFGKAHIAYIPNGKVVGLSKLARTLEGYAKRPQIQEKLTGQVADALMEVLNCQGCAVVLEAEHMCMSMRGVKKPGSVTITNEMRGTFLTDPAIKQEFLMMIRR